MDLAEMMKTIMAKEAGLSAASAVSSSVAGAAVSSAALAANLGNVTSSALGASGSSTSSGSSSGQSSSTGTPFGTTYITEKLYMVLQMYLQNKGWNSVELLQCFSEMKEAALIPNAAAYLQMMASRVTLDSQGRLVHRENGKLILPFEHFANAVMLKHMNRPHNMHLNLEATVRSVMETYTTGREYFGMEKEFIYEVVQNCPECRYYKSQIPSYHSLSEAGDSKASKGLKDLLPSTTRQHQDYKSSSRAQLPQALADAASLLRANAGTPASFSKSSANSEFSQNNLSLDLASQSMGDLKTVNAMLELSRAKAAAAAAAAAGRSSTPAPTTTPTRAQLLNAAVAAQQQQLLAEKAVRNIQQEKQQLQHLQQQQQLQLQQQQQLQHQQQIQMQIQQLQQQQQQIQQQQQQQQKLLQQKLLDQQQSSLPTMADHKLADFLRANLDSFDSFSNSNKDLLALHNGAWSSAEDQSSYKRSSNLEGGQEKIVRAFAEVMRNLHRMKMCIRPSMCKPYGKQSEMLQKTLEDTLLLVQAMRSFLPPPQY